MNQNFYKSDNKYLPLDRSGVDCCSHIEVPSMQAILQYLFRTGSTPPGVEINYPEVHSTNDDFDTNIDYRKPALQDLNKQFYAMKEVSMNFNDALKAAAAEAQVQKGKEVSDVAT